jgi:hypothetical protein
MDEKGEVCSTHGSSAQGVTIPIENLAVRKLTLSRILNKRHMRLAKEKIRIFLVTGRGDSLDCETSRLSTFYRQSAHRQRLDCQHYTQTTLYPHVTLLVVISVTV